MSGRLLVLRPGAIGDTLLTVPALVALRHRYPDYAIHVVGNQNALPILTAMGLTHTWTPFDDPSVTRLFMPGDPAPGDPLTGLNLAVAWCADPDGVLAESLRRRGASDVVIARSRPEPGDGVHIARHLIRTLAPLGIDEAAPLDVPPIALPPDMVALARAELAGAGLEPGRFAVVHPGSGSLSKNWPPERFAEVIERLMADADLPTLLLAGPADAEAVARVQATLRRPVPVVTDRPLLVLAGLLRHASLFLSNDSGLSHLAGSVGAPTLALFGPTDPALWGPLGPHVRTLRHQPLTDLNSDPVLSGVLMLLQ